MSEQKKPKRLAKVATEIGVGRETLVDFLIKQGAKDISPNDPNAKIDDEMYQKILKEFAPDRILQEESSKVQLPDLEKKNIKIEAGKVNKNIEEPEVIEDEVIIKDTTIDPIEIPEDIKPKIKVKGKIELEPKKKEPKPEEKTEKEALQAPASKDETLEKQAKTGKESTPPQKTTKETAQNETAKTEQENNQPEEFKVEVEKLSGPVLVGKIDLKESDYKSKPQKPENPFRKEKKKRKRIVKPAAKEIDKLEPDEDEKSFKQKKKFKKDKGKKYKPKISDEEVEEQLKETLSKLSKTSKSKAAEYRRQKRKAISEQQQKELERLEEEKRVLKITEFVTVGQLASMMDVDVNEIISTCLSIGLFVSINQRLDAENIALIAEEYGYKVEFASADEAIEIEEEEDNPEDLVPRPPIVTVMGHVDHGKTSLLDYIRKTNVIAGEAGGITQHIGAYNVTLENGRKITFLDTPGHEAFTAMRARGAKVTDVAVIVIAADDAVMPQTVEAINHAQAAGVPMVFAFNKIDKEGANPDKIREQLANMNILVEEWGGKYQTQEISAKKGIGVNELLEKILLEADLLDLKANPKKRAKGTVIESSLDKGRGYVATLLVQDGTLRKGDVVLAGAHSGKVKAMFNERGQRVDEAGPSIPVTVLGLDGAPNAGDKFNVMKDEKEAREIALKRQQLIREQSLRTQKHITLDEIGRRLAIGNFKELNIIIKGDVDGSIEALSDSLLKLSNDQVKVNIIHKAVGQITESDVMLAAASDAIIIGFQVRPSSGARKLAETEQIEIRLYSIIYDAIEEVKSAIEGMLAPKVEEKILGTAEIRQVFKISKVGNVAGCMVIDGKINRNSKVRVIRDGIVVYTGELGSLKQFKDDVKEVSAGHECGLNIKNFNDIKVGDIVEAYETVEVKQKL